MEFGQTAKTVAAAVFLAVAMFAVFIAGQMNPFLRERIPQIVAIPLNTYFPNGSEDGRFDSKCAASTLFGRVVCGVPFARLIATPERFHQRVIAVTGFLVTTGQGRQSLYPSEDSYRNMGEYERVEIGTGVPDAIRAKLGQGMWVRVIGEFDGTYAGQPWGLGAINQVMDIAEARPDLTAIASGALKNAQRPAQPPLEAPAAAASLLPRASTPQPSQLSVAAAFLPPKTSPVPPAPIPTSANVPPKASPAEPPPSNSVLRTADSVGEVQVSPPLLPDSPNVTSRSSEAPAALRAPTPLSDNSTTSN
jgi:hypothetical protein